MGGLRCGTALVLLFGAAACGDESAGVFNQAIGLGPPVLVIDGGEHLSPRWTGLYFGDVPPGATASTTFVVRNLGGGTLTLLQPQVWTPFTWDFAAAALGPAEQTEVEVSFTPPHEGLWRLIVVFETDAGPANFLLEGNGARDPHPL